MILVTLPFIALFVNIISAQSYQPCRQSGVIGSCQPVRTCASAVKLLQGTITPEIQTFLRNIQCSYGVEGPWVCCGQTQLPKAAPTGTVQRPAAPTQSRVSLPRAPQCGIDAPNRIFGGTETRIDEFPWLVQIQYNKPQNKKGFHCGGSLINERYVITAAHCVNKVPTTWKLSSVRLGEYDTTTQQDCDDTLVNESVCNDPVVDIAVEEKIVHESYEPNSKNQHNDIALLRLSRTVTYTDFIKPICLPLDSTQRNSDLSGIELDVSGWGKTETSSASERKLKVNINSYSNAACQSVYGTSGLQIVGTQICAGGKPGKDSCNGDSGGPLMQYYTAGSLPHYSLVGIVSYGPKNCGTKDVPGVYTRVSKYIEWIQSKIRA